MFEVRDVRVLYIIHKMKSDNFCNNVIVHDENSYLNYIKMKKYRKKCKNPFFITVVNNMKWNI